MPNATRALMIIYTLLYSSVSLSYEPDRAKTNQSHELAECVVFYSYGAEAAKRRGDVAAANAFTQSANIALYLSTQLSNEKVAKARVEMALDEQQKMIDNDFSNISILLNKYKDVCKVAVGNPEARKEYWLQKKDTHTTPERL